MIRSLRRAAVVLTALAALTVIIFLLGMRSRNRAVLTGVRRMNKVVMNPRQMATAGTPGAYAGIIRHVGRRSGRSYETPVGTVATDDGFVIALPYGTTSDWLQNVLTAGTAEVVHEGFTYPVERPEVVPLASVADRFPASEQRTFRVFGVTECLTLRRSDDQYV